MRKKTDHPPRSEKDPAHSSGAEGPETDHYEPWSKLSSTDQDLKLSEFFKAWELPASDFADCPPEAELRKKVENRNRAEWPEHVQNCANCSSLAELFSHPDRLRIPVSKILAEASRRAWEIEHSGRRRSFTVEHVTSLFNSIPQPRRNRIFAAAAAVFVLMLAWVGYQYLFSKTPNPTVAFNNRPTPTRVETYADATDWYGKAIDALASPNYTTEAKLLYLEPLESTKPKTETTFDQANLNSSQRAQAGTLVTKYKSLYTVVLSDSTSEQKVKARDLDVPPTPDSEIVSKVFLAFGSHTGSPIVFNREDPEAAKIILEAAKFTEVTNIEPKAEKTTVLITLPKDEFGEKELNTRLASLKDQGIEVIVARYTPPRGPKSKLKAINR
jgi:hypothetical protein